jgi:uncharacterized membrane protein YhaH (DUF805 family)
MKSIYDIQFWTHTAIYLVGIGMLVATPQARGRGWLVGFLGLSLVTSTAYFVANVLLRNGALAMESYRRYFEDYQPILAAINIIGSVLLLAYVIALRSAPQAAPASFSAVPGLQLHPAVAEPMTVAAALFSFSGRLSRADYWFKGFLVLLPIGIVNNLLFFSSNENSPARVFCMIVAFLSLWPSAALVTKRWHDRNRSAWWFALLLIPAANAVFLVWLLVEVWFLKGSTGPNRFGPDPLASEAVASLGEQAVQTP